MTLADGTKIDFDYLVVAIGCYQGSVEPDDDVPQATYDEVKAYYDSMGEKIRNAGSVAIIGGGPVGVELAGEIRDSHPDKKITLIHSKSALVHEQQGAATPVEFQQKILKALTDQKIDVKLGVKADLSGLDKKAGVYEGKDLQIPLSGGEPVSADLVLTAFGLRSRGASITGLPVDDKGFVKVNKALQVEGFDNVFAIGDCAASGEPKMQVIAATSPSGPGHAITAFENLKLLAAAQTAEPPVTPKLKERPTTEKPSDPFMIVPIGSRNKEKYGAAVGPPGFLHGLVLGFKRKDYFVGDVWKSINTPVPQ